MKRTVTAAYLYAGVITLADVLRHITPEATSLGIMFRAESVEQSSPPAAVVNVATT
jgi:hypothetical protein